MSGRGRRIQQKSQPRQQPQFMNTQQLIEYVEKIPTIDTPAVFPYSRMWLDDGKEEIPEDVVNRIIVGHIPRIATNPLAFERKHRLASPILAVYVEPGQIIDWLLFNFTEKPTQLLLGNQADIDMIFVDQTKTTKIPLEVLKNQFSLPHDIPSRSLLYLFVSLMNMNILYDTNSTEEVQNNLSFLPQEWKPQVISAEETKTSSYPYSLWFPKTVWITNYIKMKNYKDRTICREAIRDFFKVYDDNGIPSHIDECLIITNDENSDLTRLGISPEELAKGRFRVHSSGSSTEPVSIEYLFNLLENEYPLDIVYTTRMGIRPNKFTKLQSGMNADPSIFYYFTPFILPDVPDPRPEPYQQGKVYFMSGFLLNQPGKCLSQIPKSIRENGYFSQISLFTLNITGILGGLLTLARMKFQNSTTRIGAEIVHLDSFYTTSIQELTNVDTGKPISQVYYSSNKCVSFHKFIPSSSSSSSSSSASSGSSSKSTTIKKLAVEECRLEPMKTGPLEVLTLFNMGNKYLQRDGKNMIMVKEPRVIPGELLVIRQYENAIIRSGTIYNPIKGRGITIQGEPLTDNQYRFYKGFMNPKEDEVVFTLPEKVNWRKWSFPALLVFKYHHPEHHCYFEVPKEDNQECMKLLSLFRLQNITLYNTEDIVIQSYKNPVSVLHYSPLIKDYEYSPGLLAESSRITREVLNETRKEITINVPMSIPGIEGETSVVLEGKILCVMMMNVELEKSILKALQTMPDKDYKIMILTPEKRDLWPYMILKSDIIIGHTSHPAWVYTLLAKKTTGIIEIDSEHKYVPNWYFWNSLQEKIHYIIPLKEEPLFRHCMRIEKYLKDYIDLIEKSSS
jgi:hypothetical protein